jgi:hypothetical protein
VIGNVRKISETEVGERDAEARRGEREGDTDPECKSGEERGILGNIIESRGWVGRGLFVRSL